MSTLFSNKQLLEEISKSAVTKKHNTIEHHYYKGWKDFDNISTFDRTIGPLVFGDNILPTDNTAMQITSTNTLDTNISVLIIGWTNTWEYNEVNIFTNGTNGTTPVSLGVNLFRIKSMRKFGGVGDIFLSKTGATYSTPGIPDSYLDYIYSIKGDENVGAIANGVIPPKVNGYIHPNYIIISTMNETIVPLQVELQMKRTDSVYWNTKIMLVTREDDNTQFVWDLSGLNDIPNNNMSYGYDMRITVKLLAITAPIDIRVSGAISMKQSVIEP